MVGAAANEAEGLQRKRQSWRRRGSSLRLTSGQYWPCDAELKRDEKGGGIYLLKDHFMPRSEWWGREGGGIKAPSVASKLFLLDACLCILNPIRTKKPNQSTDVSAITSLKAPTLYISILFFFFLRPTKEKTSVWLCQDIWLAVFLSDWNIVSLQNKSTGLTLTSQIPGSGILPLICCHGAALWRRKWRISQWLLLKRPHATGILPHRQQAVTGLFICTSIPPQMALRHQSVAVSPVKTKAYNFL